MSVRARRSVAIAVSGALVLWFGTGESASAGSTTKKFTAAAIAEVNREEGRKSVTGSLAESDPTLVARTDSEVVSVGVKLDYDASASYAGGVDQLAATSPRVTGEALTGATPAEVAYDAYTGTLEAGFQAELAAEVPSATITRTLSTVYGGAIVRLPANQAKQLLSFKNVVAVQSDTLNQIQTDSSTTFIGAPTMWSALGGQSTAGKGVIFADLDSGLWPEHPSLADNPALGTPPPTSDGHPRACNYGDNPLTPAVDVFVCNSKVIGGQPFIDTYNSLIGSEEYETSARDSDGHGTHTTTTAAGDVVTSATIFGIERGPASGVAPGAWVIEYKVCGAEGCFGSDTAAAAEQAILDGANVINYSISGGANPYADITELAFLDAYDAGILVAASAGNSGPGASTTDHRSPWVTTVAASTQQRTFQSTLTIDGTTTFVGSSITTGVSTATPIVLASTIPGYSAQCLTVPDATQAPLVTGKIIACQRGGDDVGRVAKGERLHQVGAAGMVLYNLPLQDTETDNHFLPALHIADGTALVAYLTAHPVATATFTEGVKAAGQGDVMAAFSSRGPGGQFLKPDITAPGVQILAGNTPMPDAVPAGPPGEYYQAIAGTSMSAPHIAGSAILLKALRPEWTPGEIKSAMMTTATTNVVKEDLVTPADPFDFGAGRVDLNVAGTTDLVLDESASNMFANGQDPISALALNLPSINIPTMPGIMEVKRTITNTGKQSIWFNGWANVPAGSRVTIKPSFGVIIAGKSKTFTIRITSNAPTGQYFGDIIIGQNLGRPKLHLPIAYFNQQGPVTLTSACVPPTISMKANQTSTCTVTAENTSFAPARVSMTSSLNSPLTAVSATSATITGPRSITWPTATLAGKQEGVPAITSGDTPSGGYLDLGSLRIAPIAVGDETIANFDVPAFQFAGKSFTRIGVTSNGYIVAGGGTSADVDHLAQTLPNQQRPNGVIAPYWTNLDGDGSPGISVASLKDRDGPNSWTVVQWQVHYFGVNDGSSQRKFQVWLGANGVEDVSMGFDASALQGVPDGVGPLTTGAENTSGTGGAQIAGPPAGSYVIKSSAPVPGATASYTVTVKGARTGNGVVTSSMTASIVPGTTVVLSTVVVKK